MSTDTYELRRQRLKEAGVGPPALGRIASAETLERIEAAIEHVRSQPGVRNRPGFLVTLLRGGEDHPAVERGAKRRRDQRPAAKRPRPTDADLEERYRREAASPAEAREFLREARERLAKRGRR